MQVIVKKWGNCASVCIPPAVMAAARLELNDIVDVREKSGRIIIEPLRPQPKPSEVSPFRKMHGNLPVPDNTETSEGEVSL